ncbi:MAG: PQQ-binding-like beta-propeller repeat protein, partial [Elusimicrobia bacterium]|nr:PQQ-binding-like beta-propeller repeat protein [Elusimicrobiota bacterium]MBD3412566.1 PQQ-binding-like beta-propeller repeat protein [Elusimicrobiota bacterium]
VYNIRDDTSQGTKIWKRDLPGDVKGVLGFTLDYIYVGCSDGNLYKLDINTGNDAAGWTYDQSIYGELYELAIDFTPGVNATWFGSSNGIVYRVRNNDGTVTSQFQTEDYVTTAPWVLGGFSNPNKGSNDLYIPSLDGKLYCRTSANLYNIPDGWSGINGEYDAGSSITTWVWLHEEAGGFMVYFGTEDGRIIKLDSADGSLVWQFQAGGPIRSDPVVIPGYMSGVDDDYVYFGCDDSQVYAIKTSDKSLRSGWPIVTGGAVRSSPVFDGANWRIYFTSTDGKTYCIYVGP